MKILLFITCLFGWSMIYSQTTTLDNCHVRAELYDLPSKISLVSLQENQLEVEWEFANQYKTHTLFQKKYGLISDSTAFMSLFLLREHYGIYYESIPYNKTSCFYALSIGDSIDKFCYPLFMEYPYLYKENVFYLDSIFNVISRGKYVLIGYYKTICDGIIKLHRMDEIYFEIY